MDDAQKTQGKERLRKWVKTNPEAAREAQARWRREHPEKIREYALKHYYAKADVINARAVHKNRERKYGITQEQYEARLVAQGHVCAICGKPETNTRKGKLKSLAVDHDHTTGVIRGLLCGACNAMLGQSHDSVAVLEAAILYLKKASTLP